MRIGKRIKELRQAHEMKLKDLSEKSGVQIATLSRIEHGKMAGTIESHMSIAKALGVDITDLYKGLDHEEALERLMSAPPIETFTYNEKASYEILTNKVLGRKMMPVMLRIEEGGATNPEENPEGAEKFLFILDGEVTAHVADKTITLSKHMTLYIDASQRHRLVNTGAGTAKIISVITPVAL